MTGHHWELWKKDPTEGGDECMPADPEQKTMTIQELSEETQAGGATAEAEGVPAERGSGPVW